MKKLFVCAPAVLLACTGCSHNPRLLPDQASPVTARVIDVTATPVQSTVGLTGVIGARQMADISSQVLAPVAEISVHEGDKVRKGEVLVRLSSVPLQMAVEQAQSQLIATKKQELAAEAQKNLAAETYARYATLNQRHSVTPHEFDQVKAQLDAANAQLQASAAQSAATQAAVGQSQATRAYSVLRAPFNGIVTGKYVDVGAMASPGIPLLRIEDDTAYEADIQVNESILSKIHLGEKLQVDVNGSQLPVVGDVREIAPGGDPAVHTFTIKIALPSSASLHSGMTARVLIPTGGQPTIVVPKSAIRLRGQLDSVLALDGSSSAQIRYVTVGQTHGDTAEIISGLTSGDRVVAQARDFEIGHRIEPQP